MSYKIGTKWAQMPFNFEQDILPCKFLTHEAPSQDPNIHLPDTRYAGTDSPALFHQNLKIQDPKWHYREKEIQYSVNSYGYRTNEFDLINWPESIVIFGCSIVAGIGLAEDETISHHLASILGRPVINLGYPGGGNDLIAYNNFFIANKFPTPYAVINLWSTMDRHTLFDSNGTISCGAWSMQQGNITDLWNENIQNPICHSQFLSFGCKAIWSKTKYITGSFFHDTAHFTCSKYYSFTNTARDLLHPGKEDANRCAVDLANRLKSIS